MRRSLVVLLLCVVGPRPVLADERPARRVGLQLGDGMIGVSVGLKDLFGAGDGDEQRLRSGFVSRVVIRVELYRDGEPNPFARADRRGDVLFDLWDERFRVRLVDRDGVSERQADSIGEAIDQATALVHFPVTTVDRAPPPGIYRFRLRADLNPISEDLMADVRKWLVRPPGQGRGTSGDSVFGSVVSIFVNPHIEQSERQISFWSQPFVLNGGGG